MRLSRALKGTEQAIYESLITSNHKLRLRRYPMTEEDRIYFGGWIKFKDDID